MFQRLIRNYIDFWKKHVDELERAYEETYAETSKEFNKTLKEIREKNKREFIETSGDWLMSKMKEETGLNIPKAIRNKFGEKMFEIAEQRGDLDEFNKFKEER
jgi:hypothetical protein